MTIAPARTARPVAFGVNWVEDWAPLGRCAKSDPDALFVQGAAQQTAKIVCQGCPVIAECLADALDNRTEFGVWGGMTERERRALLKRRPNITSWASLFAQARAAQFEQSAAVSA
ncbi:MAG TPA: WhiB family transcriptional regulator [Pedococcus sp.]|jgi:WhiB family redox-sensing transcriptional regulator|nr:WhiB family transcriptional regulator [Pedococcus sp.]